MESMEKIFVGNPRYFEQRGEITSPEQLIYLIMDMPFGCQLKCLKCYRKLAIRPDALNLRTRKNTISEAAELGAKVFALPGEGEPLLYWDQTKALIAHAHSLGLITILYTNGIHMTENITHFLFDHGASPIFSCDSIDTGRYRKLTGVGSLGTARKGFEMLARVYRDGVARSGDTMQTRLSLISIACKDNASEIPALKQWAGESDAYFICNFPVKIGNAVKNWEVLVGNQEARLREIAQKYSDTHFGGLTTPTCDGRCAALYHGITVDADGSVLSCPASVGQSVGRIDEGNVSSLHNEVLHHAKINGSPSCILRFNQNPEPRKHDGLIITSV